jgi:hypothetical protein
MRELLNLCANPPQTALLTVHPFPSAARFCLSASIAVLISAGSTFAADESGLPANLGGGLKQLAAWHATQVSKLAPQSRTAAVQQKLKTTDKRIQSDADGRVVVDVYLNGSTPLEEVQTALTALDARVLASVPAGTKAAAHGMISVFLPIGQAATAAKLPGVQSVMLVHRPWHHVGAKSSQGVPVMKVSAVQRRKFKGLGIKIGVISDSYDLTEPTAATNVVKDDLPGLKNRGKHLIPVDVIEDGDPADTYNSDEGRAMLQIIHDVAPDSALAFCAVGATQATFAQAIRSLRTQGLCDVLVDDIGFLDEPMFSDGIVAQAVQDVTNSTTLAGRKVLYYSAAGNGGELGYEADFSAVSDVSARAGLAGTNNLQLTQVPAGLTAGGFHNFTPGAGTTIAQKFTARGAYAELNFQWNDLFDAASMTSDYNVLVFDAEGNYLSDISGKDDAFSTGLASEIIDLDVDADGNDVTYQLAITRTAAGTGTAKHFRYVTDTEGDIDAAYLTPGVPTIVGHPGARDCDAVGAYAYKSLKQPETFSSFGPVSVYFDDNDNRLTVPEIRQQPTISGPDGVATSLPDFNPFFGTSAAAPHLAGVAALFLQAAGGPGSLTGLQIRQALQGTTFPHDLDVLTTTATATSANATVTVRGYGDDSGISASSDEFFTLNFTTPNGTQLQTVLIDLTASGLKFDSDADLGHPFTVSESSAGVNLTSAVVQKGDKKLLLTFSAFPSGGTLKFGIDRDIARYKSGGNSANQLLKAVVTSTLLPPSATKPVKQKGVFVNTLGAGYSPADGFGFINADAALKTLGH